MYFLSTIKLSLCLSAILMIPFTAEANQPPVISNVSGSIDSSGNLTVRFTPSDPEGSSMGADIYLSHPNNTSSYQSSSKKTHSNFSGTSSRTQTYTQSELNTSYTN